VAFDWIQLPIDKLHRMGEHVAAARVESPALNNARETGLTWNWLVGIRCRVQISFAILERMPDTYPWERLPRYWRRCINAIIQPYLSPKLSGVGQNWLEQRSQMLHEARDLR